LDLVSGVTAAEQSRPTGLPLVYSLMPVISVVVVFSQEY